MATFQVKINGIWHDEIELHLPTLDDVAEEFRYKPWTGKEIIAVTPIISKLILQYHSGPHFDQNPHYVDFDLDIDRDSYMHDVVKLSYTGTINWRRPHQDELDVQKFSGEVSVM